MMSTSLIGVVKRFIIFFNSFEIPRITTIPLIGAALKELKEEALYFLLNDVMFPPPPPPPPPPPVPIAPLTMKDQYGDTWNITQSADGIYYGKCGNLGKKIMTICTGIDSSNSAESNYCPNTYPPCSVP